MKLTLDQTAALLKAMGHPKRLAILNLLKSGPVTLEGLTRALGVRKPNVSQHLTAMRLTGIVTMQRQGRLAIYSLAEKLPREIVNLIEPYTKLP